MKIALLVAIAFAAFAVFFLKSRVVNPSSVAVKQIPAVVQQLRTKGRDESWAVFMFTPAGEAASDDTNINLQYSMENGRAGLDWVLLGPRNRADAEKVASFAKQRAHTVVEHLTNDVRYLRIEDGDISGLGVQIIGELYHLGRNDEISLITDNFEWQP